MFREGALRAAAVHLALSALVVALLLGAFIGIWYPPPLLQGAGGLRLMLIVAGVDIILGPLITVMIYKRGKPGLRFDLGVIATLQALALAYGLHVAWISRPAYIVLTQHRATLVSANEVYPAERSSAAPLWGASVVLAIPPSDGERRQALLFETLDGKPDIEYRPEFYRPLSDPALVDIHASAEPVEGVTSLPGTAGDVANDTRRLPLITRERELEVWFSLTERRVVAIRLK